MVLGLIIKIAFSSEVKDSLRKQSFDQAQWGRGGVGGGQYGSCLFTFALVLAFYPTLSLSPPAILF